jgi:hypothetical protein
MVETAISGTGDRIDTLEPRMTTASAHTTVISDPKAS